MAFWKGRFSHAKTMNVKSQRIFWQDYLDAERASCLMNTHWNTVWSNGESQGAFPVPSTAWFDRVSSVCCNSAYCASSSSTFSRSGVRIPVKAIFCDVTPMTTTHINQSIKLFKKYSPLIDRCRKLGEGKKSKKLILTGIRTPDLETWNLQWNWNCHSTLKRKTGKAPVDCPLLHTVFQWVFIRHRAFSASR